MSDCFPIKLISTHEDGIQTFEFCFCAECCGIVATYIRTAAERTIQVKNKMADNTGKDE